MSPSRHRRSLVALVVGMSSLLLAAPAVASATPQHRTAKHGTTKHPKHPKKHVKKHKGMGKPKPQDQLVAPRPAPPMDMVTGVAQIGFDSGGAGPVSIDAHKLTGAPDASAGGFFDGNATLVLQGTSTGVEVLHFSGPVDCLQVDGNQAGLIYPVAASNVPGLVGQAIKITVIDNGGGGKDMLGFEGPAPEALLGGCAPSIALMPVSGHLTVHHG